ncbi:MAG: hypothetical protein H6569_12215 [Lewinellaceae bacterium]|nr:hypothetical protein [Lewinellaceae bacterium]
MFTTKELSHIESQRQKLQRWRTIHTVTRPGLRKRWIRMGIRWTLALILYPTFWEYQWVRIAFYIALPLGLFYLLLMIGLTWGLPQRIARLERELGESPTQPPSGFEPDSRMDVPGPQQH